MPHGHAQNLHNLPENEVLSHKSVKNGRIWRNVHSGFLRLILQKFVWYKSGYVLDDPG